MKENAGKPLVSVVMNCYNGEKYLHRSLDSVLKQTYDNWELIFWDNCSIDHSKEILDSYNEPRFRYFRSEKNVNLGQARAWAVEKCEGDYIAFLDVDDEWLPKKIEIQLSEMQKDNYVLAVTAYNTIQEDNNNQKGVFVSPRRSGFLFEQELTNFDIGMVESMVKRAALIEKRLNFDPSVKASEEYCLFMQLIYDEKVCVIHDVLANYYIRRDSLTNKCIDRWYIERFYTLDRILERHPDAERRFPDAFKEARARGFYYKARYFMSLKKKKEARLCLAQTKNVSIRYRLLYYLTFFPVSLWKRIHLMKNKR